MIDEHTFWSEWLEDQLSSAPGSLKTAFPMSTWFHYADTFTSLKSSAFLSIYLSILLMLLVLLASTGNMTVSLIATLCTACVAAEFIGFMVLVGWTLGIMESVCMTILVGLSVDYVVHMAHAYTVSQEDDNQSRIKHAMRSMAMGVTCGALTTILGSCFLINCVILFFSRFGTFIVFTLSAAYLHALLVFPAALAICGPTTTHTNDWRRLRNWLDSNWLDGRRNGRDYKSTAVEFADFSWPKKDLLAATEAAAESKTTATEDLEGGENMGKTTRPRAKGDQNISSTIL
mmetsp:Transcript_21990/g.36677  ORF Transcript_21990/g.36677 Transcript_21990/m.36677 type:complete len:288 (+) Transcript_21990:133-996(+)